MRNECLALLTRSDCNLYVFLCIFTPFFFNSSPHITIVYHDLTCSIAHDFLKTVTITDSYFNSSSFFIYFQCNWNKFPCVLKAGHCHGGRAIAKLDIAGALQDAAGLLCGPVINNQGSYCCIEPYVDAKYDVLIQKIGSSYKAFM